MVATHLVISRGMVAWFRSGHGRSDGGLGLLRLDCRFSRLLRATCDSPMVLLVLQSIARFSYGYKYSHTPASAPLQVLHLICCVIVVSLLVDVVDVWTFKTGRVASLGGWRDTGFWDNADSRDVAHYKCVRLLWFFNDFLHFSYIAKQCVFFNECWNCLLLKGAFTGTSRYISDNYRAEVTASSGWSWIGTRQGFLPVAKC